MRALAVGVVLLHLLRIAHADTATAKAAFEQGEKLTVQGKWTQACPYFEASFNADPQLGALLALAECHERIGRIASSWSELNDALVIAKERQDPRQKDIELAINELAPRVPKLAVTPPPQPIAGLTVKRGTSDITLLVGTEIPTDAGAHEIIVEAPEHETWRTKVTLEEGKLTTVAIPALAKAVAKPAVAQEGTLKITTLPGAQIMLDSTVIGTGSAEIKVKAGGHMLRVTASGMRAYQSEIVVGANEMRTIDVPLDKEVVAVPVDDGPDFELGATLGGGIKARGGNPAMVMLRIEAALRLGKRVNFGVFAEYGSIDTGDHCGFDMPGPFPASEFDFGPRNQFHRCAYLMPGLQLYVHLRPKQKLDPYVGIAPGFRFGFTEWTPYAAGLPGDRQSEIFPGVVLGVRGGVNYHPRPDLNAWQIGGYLGADITLIGQEAQESMSDGGRTSLSLVGGMRSSFQF